MAMIDYGVIAKKNGKILTTAFFTDMKDALGFSIEKSDCGEPIEECMEGWIKKEDKFENECNECCMKCDKQDKCDNNCMINSFHIWCDICKHD